jgi:precorrin-2 dehydrogenase/sirohydrochlorin ferrochelatase
VIRYPVYLDLSNRRVLVVGGGKVASRKIPALLKGGAVVTVVSPSLSPELLALFRSEKFRWVRRRYISGDERNFSLILALTDKPDVNRRISARFGGFVNQATPSAGNPAALPYVQERSPVLVAVGSEPPDPLLVREVGEFLGEKMKETGIPEYAREHTLLRQILLEDGWPRFEIREVLEKFSLGWAFRHPVREERLAGYAERLDETLVRRLVDRL